MSLTAFLEVAIGLVFTYLLLSLIATWVNETIASVFKLRANDLKKAIQDLLEDPDKVKEFYEHPLIKALSRQKNGQVKRLPAYIPDRTFALVALDVLSEKKALITESADELKPLIDSLPSGGVKDTFDTFWRAGAKSVESLRSDVETWFNDKMDRLSGVYKRRAQLISGVVGLVLAVGLNIDTITITDALWREPALRTGITEYVTKNAEEYDSEDDVDVPVDELRETLASLQLPMGWGTYAPRTSAMMSSAKAAGRDENWAVFTGWLLTGVGWLLTGLAVSQGAPFWFQLLMKLVNLRSSGAVPKVEEEAKELEALLEVKLKGVKEDLLDELKKPPSS
jgi:hypothetical protein